MGVSCQLDVLTGVAILVEETVNSRWIVEQTITEGILALWLLLCKQIIGRLYPDARAGIELIGRHVGQTRWLLWSLRLGIRFRRRI